MRRVHIYHRAFLEAHALGVYIGEALQQRDWEGVLLYAKSEERAGWALDLLPRIACPSERARVLAYGITMGDVLVRVRDRLVRALRTLRDVGHRVFDSAEAAQTFGALPNTITAYRGTTKAEGRKYGVSWTLDRERAIWFATKHGRFRNTSSPPVLLTTGVTKAAVCGLLLEREEREVLLIPRDLRDGVSCEALS